MTITISRTKQSVAHGLGRSDRSSFRGGLGVLDFSDSASSAARTDSALSSAGGGVHFGSNGVAAGAPREKKAGRVGRAWKSIAGRVTRIFRNLPLSKLKIVLGKSATTVVPYDMDVHFDDTDDGSALGVGEAQAVSRRTMVVTCTVTTAKA